jgi:hypothetical protein
VTPRKLDPVPLTLLVLAVVGGAGAAALDGADRGWALLVLIPMIAIIGVSMLRTRLRQRRATVTDWATRNGWSALAAPDGPWRGSPPFSEPTGRASEELGRSYRGFPVSSFTWTWNGRRRPGTRTTPQHQRHVIVLELPGDGPVVQLTPRILASTLALMPESPTGDQRFDAVWHVGSAQPGAVALDEQLRNRLLREDAQLQVLRFEGGSALSWTVGETDVERILPRVATLWALADLLGRTA